jgi:hypothetical protein
MVWSLLLSLNLTQSVLVAGLALSGGGVRSAAFQLGVFDAFAQFTIKGQPHDLISDESLLKGYEPSTEFPFHFGKDRPRFKPGLPVKGRRPDHRCVEVLFPADEAKVFVVDNNINGSMVHRNLLAFFKQASLSVAGVSVNDVRIGRVLFFSADDAALAASLNMVRFSLLFSSRR